MALIPELDFAETDNGCKRATERSLVQDRMSEEIGRDRLLATGQARER